MKLTVGQHQNILAAVAEAKFDLDEAKGVLESSKYRDEVMSSILATQKQGVHSIPQFTFSWSSKSKKRGRSAKSNHRDERTNKTVVVHGSATVEAFEEALQDICDDLQA